LYEKYFNKKALLQDFICFHHRPGALKIFITFFFAFLFQLTLMSFFFSEKLKRNFLMKKVLEFFREKILIWHQSEILSLITLRIFYSLVH
jgi:hypothetical protein